MWLTGWQREALGVACAVACTLAVPWTAFAGDTQHPPTPVIWPEPESCVITVDRSVEPVLHLDYEIPFEDTLKTGHEVEDSRTHQFLALCRQYPHGHPPPKYVSVADLERAIETENELELSADDPLATMETHPEWSDCFARINADDARLPITFESVEAGVDWDTTDVQPGVYQVVGYTWEPPRNLFVRAPFVVRVTDGDGDDPVAIAPLAIASQTLSGDESLPLMPCVDLGDQPADGLAIRGRWALADQANQPDAWSTFEQRPLTQAAGAPLTFAPPEAAHGLPVVLAADVVAADEQSLSPAAHGLRELIVIVPSSDDTDGGTDTGGDGPGPGQDDDATATGCRITGEAPPLPFLLALCALPLARLRRHPPQNTTEDLS